MIGTRVDFFNKIDKKTNNRSLYDIIRESFDEIMSLYDLVFLYSNFNIMEGEKVATFDLTFEEQSNLSKLYNEINNTNITKYNKIFLVSCNITENNILHIEMKQVSST